MSGQTEETFAAKVDAAPGGDIEPFVSAPLADRRAGCARGRGPFAVDRHPRRRLLAPAPARFQRDLGAVPTSPGFWLLFSFRLFLADHRRLGDLPPPLAHPARRDRRAAAQASLQRFALRLFGRALFLYLGAAARRHHRRAVRRDQGRRHPLGDRRQHRHPDPVRARLSDAEPGRSRHPAAIWRCSRWSSSSARRCSP